MTPPRGAELPDRASWTHGSLAPSCVVFALTFLVGAMSLLRHTQLGYLRGLADRWFALGLNLASYGVLGDGVEPTVFKPPGYPAFIAAVLSVFGPPPAVTPRPSSFPPTSTLMGLVLPYPEPYLDHAASLVYWSHCALLAASAALLCAWLSRLARPASAFLAALSFGANPYSVILIGILHYGVLHWLALIASCWVLDRAVDPGGRPVLRLMLAGACWGIATLVRPVTLILPLFVLGALLFLRWPSWRRSLAETAAFTLGMSLVIAPYTVRNYLISGRIIPVNAQAWMTVWAATVKPISAQPNHYRWKEVREPLMRVLRNVPERPLTTGPSSIKDNLLLESEFRQVVLKNLRRRPGVYVRNCLSSFLTFNIHINAVLLKMFQYAQEPRAQVQDWYWPGQEQDFYPSRASDVFTVLFVILTVLGAAGLAAAVRNRDRVLTVPAVVYMCLAVGHAVTWMDFMYYYVKLPFLFVFAFYFVDHCRSWRLRVAARSFSAARLLATLLAVSFLTLSAYVLW